MEHQKIGKILEKAQESDLLSEGGQSLAPREGEKGRKGWEKERREGSKGADDLHPTQFRPWRLQGDLSTQDALVTLATSPEKCAMFPVFSAAIYRLLLLPVGTASVERSFSTMNRILSSERCRLLPGHTCQLMQLAVEGPRVPDVRDADVEELAQFSAFLETAYILWLAKPRRGL